MTSRISGLAVAALATTALAVAPSTALGGQKVRVESEITMRIAGPEPIFGGRVKADKPLCKWHREVKVYFRRPGEDRRLVRTKTTGRDGRWSQAVHLHGDLTAINFFAVVTREKKRGYICLRDKSPVFSFSTRPRFQ